MYNRAELIGRLTKNPEVKYTQSGKAVCSFSLATNEGYGEKQTTEYINVVTWEKVAENCGNRLVKGSLVFVAGKLSTRSYEKKNGEKAYVTEVIGREVKFLDGKKEESSPFDVMGKEVESEIPF